MWVFWQRGILSSMKAAGVCAVLEAEGDTTTSLQSCLLQSCVLPWSGHCCLLVRLLFWESGKLSKRFIFKYLLNRGRDDSLQNLGVQAGVDGLCIISILVTFSRCCVVLLCGNNLWHIEESEHQSLTFMVNYSYSVAVLEETKMHCSSETQVPVWDFECESALLNLGFARSFKVSRFVNSLFLPWIFWNKSLIFFFPFSFPWIVADIYGGWVWSGVLGFFWEWFGFWSGRLKQWGTGALPQCFTEGILVEGPVDWLGAVPCRSLVPGFSCCMSWFVWMRLQDEGMWPELWKDPRTDLYSLANNFPVFCAERRIFFIPNVVL